jgi:tagatose-1,6-bisphosphate aldolase
MSLDRLRDPGGTFRVLAIDHRDSLRAFIDPDRPDDVHRARLVAIKRDLVATISPSATGVMLEPELSIPDVLDVLAPGVGFIAALEAQGYLSDPGATATTLFWPVQEAVATGADAVKLLVPYHPDHELAAAQRVVAAAVVDECRTVGIPIVLEPLFHSLATPADRERVVLTTVDHFAGTGADLLKLPFPVDPDLTTDVDRRTEACTRVTERCDQPWALLSGGGSFESFAAQVEVAAAAGAAGFMVGRALWGEAARADEIDRAAIITQVVLPRWNHLARCVEPRVEPRADHRVESRPPIRATLDAEPSTH